VSDLLESGEMRKPIVVASLLVGLVACGSSSGHSSGVGDAGDAARGERAEAGHPDARSKDSGRDAPQVSDARGTGDADGIGDGTASNDAGHKGCKRGIATNTAPTAAFLPSGKPGISWWYNWSAAAPDGGAGIEFVPMIWGTASLSDSAPKGSRYLLGFNEPNFKAQSDLTPQQAAADWPMVEAAAKAANVPIVSPAVNFCGSASDSSGCSDPTVTDPYTYLKDFFTACPGCEVDYVAVHWYNCDLPSLEAYLEGNLDSGGGLQGFVQFGKPIWLTEFSCDGTHSVADQTAYMQAAVPYLEANPHVFRYSWFSAAPIPNAQLASGDGSLTALGTTYVGLAQSCE
jgi:hypothetical protein